MATVSDSVRTIAAGFSIPRPRVFVVGRTIREEDSTLLPRDPVGRNLGTHLLPPHIVNLMLGVAIGDPITRVTEQVRAYRLAGYYTPIGVVLGEVKTPPPILGRQSLGLDFDSFVDFLARPSEKAQEIRRAWRDNFVVTLIVGEIVPVTVENTATGQVDIYYPYRSQEQAPKETFQYQGKEYPVVPLQRVVRLRLHHFELAAALWADSLKHGAVYTPSLLDPSGIEPENKTAAPGPGKDQNAAAVSDQTASARLDGTTHTHPIRGREKAQLSRVERPGRHIPFVRNDP